MVDYGAKKNTEMTNRAHVVAITKYDVTSLVIV